MNEIKLIKKVYCVETEEEPDGWSCHGCMFHEIDKNTSICQIIMQELFDVDCFKKPVIFKQSEED